MQTILLTFIPVAAAILGAIIAVNARPSAAVISSVQHLAAGVVFAATAAEILPDLLHYRSPVATLVGGAAGVGLMLLVMRLEASRKGPLGMVVATGVDLVVDGLVLGIGFAAGAKAGILLTVALTLEVLFLGLTVAEALGGSRSRTRAVVGTGLLMLGLPLGALVATPVSTLPGPYVAAFLSFGVMALLYLVTEELLVEAHEKPDSPWISSFFFVGFLAVLLLDEAIG